MVDLLERVGQFSFMNRTDELKRIQREAQDELERAQNKLNKATRHLEDTQNSCHHQWGETLDASVYHPGYTIPGDPPGTMGIDWRGPCHVESRTDKKWKRVCKLCGKEETTTQINKIVTETPRF